jgi:hypothetical protein
MSDLWIGEAIEKPGATRAIVKRKYGKKAFTERGTIKPVYLHKLIRSPSTTMTTKRRARLALTFRHICPYKKGKRCPCKHKGTRRCPATRYRSLGR